MNRGLERLKREAPEWAGPWLNISSVSLATLPCLQRRWPPICLTITWRIISSMSVQMSQVLPLAKDKAANSELKLAFRAKTDSCIESWSDWRESVLLKFRGRLLLQGLSVRKTDVWIYVCVCVCVHSCVCVSLVYFTDWNCWRSPVLTN